MSPTNKNGGMGQKLKIADTLLCLYLCALWLANTGEKVIMINRQKYTCHRQKTFYLLPCQSALLQVVLYL